MSEVTDERVDAVADKGAEPTSVEVNEVLRAAVQEEIARLDRAEKAPNDALTPYGRFTRVCLKRWLSWLDLPNTRDQLGNVARIVAAMEHDLLRNPPRGDVAAVLPMRDALTLYRVACGWIGHEPRVTKLEIEEEPERATLCGQHFGTAQHPTRYLCELPDGHEGLHAAPSVQIKQHAEPVRMEMLGGGLMAEIGPIVIGEEIAKQLNAGVEPATGKGAVDVDLRMTFDTRCGVPFGPLGEPKEVCALRWDHPGAHAKGVIRVDDLPEPSREECEADAKLHEEIVAKLARAGQDPDPDEVLRALDEQCRRHGHVEPEIPAAARAWVKERREVEILNEIAIWGERFCTSGRYEPQMMPQRGLYRALRRLQAVRNGDAVPPPFPEPDDDEGKPIDQWKQAAQRVGEELGGLHGVVGYYSMTPEAWREWALGRVREDRAPEDVVTECEATDSKGDRFCHHKAAVLLCHYHSRVWEVVEDASSQLARIAEYIASQPVSRFPGAAGRDVAEVVIDALRASGEQREGVRRQEQDEYEARLMANRRRVRREAIARGVLPTLIGDHDPRYTVDSRVERRRELVEIALAWADSLIEAVDRNETLTRR